MIESVLFPSDYFNKSVVDEELKREYEAVLACGKYKDVYIFSYDDWFLGGRLKLNKLPDKKGKAVYRGWMMKTAEYARFYSALAEKNIVLLTSPHEYEGFHLFSNVYPLIQKDTPKALFFPHGTKIDLEKIKAIFPRFMVKDYVKSVKGTDFPVFFDANVTQSEWDFWIEKFYGYRGGLFTGGICIKEFVELKQYGAHKNEYRVFYLNGKILSVCRNSSQDVGLPAPPRAMIEAYQGLPSPFYTVDFAEKSDGTWVILEAGDGGVSGLADEQDHLDFFTKLSEGE